MLDQKLDHGTDTPDSSLADLAWAIACDFDGTISLQDTTDAMLAQFATPEWLTIEAQFESGAIGSGQCMRDQVALIYASAAQLETFVRNLELDPDFIRFVQLTRFYKLPMQVMSDGLDHNVKLSLERFGLNLPFAANALEPNGRNGWRMHSPFAYATCRVNAGTCKCQLMTKLTKQAAREDDTFSQIGAAIQPHRVLLIGDGRSDFCAATQADFVFAKGKLARHCQLHGLAYAEIRSFSDAVRLLPALLKGDLLISEPNRPDISLTSSNYSKV